MVKGPTFLSLTALSGTRYRKAAWNHLQQAKAICGPKSRGASSWYNAPVKRPGDTAVFFSRFQLFFSLFLS